MGSLAKQTCGACGGAKEGEGWEGVGGGTVSVRSLQHFHRPPWCYRLQDQCRRPPLTVSQLVVSPNVSFWISVKAA